MSSEKGLGVPTGNACEAEAGFDRDVRGWERAEGLLDLFIVGKVMQEEGFASSPGAAGRCVEV